MSPAKAQKTRKVLYLIGLLLLAVAFRLYGVLSHPAVPSGDAPDYHRLATGLVEGQGYVNAAGTPTAWRPPGYPVFLAGIYKIVGISVLRATIAQAILGGLTVLALTALGAMIVGWRRALIAGAIAAVYPAFIWLPRLLMSENLSLFLLLLSLLSVTLYLRTPRIAWMIVFGVLCALNSLVRGANLFVPVAVALGLLVVQRRKQIVAPLLAMTVAFIVTLLPWTIRNYRVFHHVVPVATQDGMALYASYFPPQRNSRPIWGTLPGDEDPAMRAAEQTGDEASASTYLNQLTRQRLRENPGFFFA